MWFVHEYMPNFVQRRTTYVTFTLVIREEYWFLAKLHLFKEQMSPERTMALLQRKPHV